MDLVKHKVFSKLKYKQNRRFFKSLTKVKSSFLDSSIHSLHDKVFEDTNCLACANCCKTTSPVFTDKDIVRVAKYLRLKPSQFFDKYLKIDEDKDYILKSLPCMFLLEDNSCSIYKVRPKACREFPHTNRRKQVQLLKLTEKNVEVCPAVFEIIEKLKKELVK